jgi:WhiB family transcriptional regulator, redox-sensing transcriptional regulator
VSVQTVSDAWQLRAACRGPRSTVFFPPTTGERRDEREARETKAKRICAECAVRADCLDYALAIREPHGVWGGLNEHERAALLAPATATN